MRKFLFLLCFLSIMGGFVSGISVVNYYNNLCKSYDFDRGALFTNRGVFCERTVHASWEVPFLPLDGAKRQHYYRNNPDPRFIPASIQTQGL